MQIANESTVTGIAGKLGEMYKARNIEQTDFSAILSSVNSSISKTANAGVKKTSISGTLNGKTLSDKNSTRADSRNADGRPGKTEKPRSEDSKKAGTRNEVLKTSGTDQKKNASDKKNRCDDTECSEAEGKEPMQEVTGMTVGKSVDSDPEIRIAEMSLQRSDTIVNEQGSGFESQLANIAGAGISDSSDSAEEAELLAETANSAEPIIQPELYNAVAEENNEGSGTEESVSNSVEPASELMSFLEASRSANPLVKGIDKMASASSGIINNGSQTILQDNTKTTAGAEYSTEFEDPIAQTEQIRASAGSSSETDASSWAGGTASEVLSDTDLGRNRMKLLNRGTLPDMQNSETGAVMSEDAIIESDTMEHSFGRMSFLDGLKELNRTATSVHSDTGNISAVSRMSGGSLNVQTGINPGMNFAAQMQSSSAGGSAEISSARDSVELEISGGSNTGSSVGLASDKSLFSEKLQELAEIQKPVHMSRNYEENARQIAEKINIMLARNLKEAEMNLDPTGLGKMKISLQMSEEGVVRINMIVQQGETKDLVYESMNRLREVMQQGGITLGESSVEHQESWAQNSQNGETSRANDQTFGRINGSEHEDSINVSVKVSDRAVDYFA